MSSEKSEQASSKPKRGRGNPNWVKGKSGNPGGRPKVAGDIRELARQFTHVAVETLVTIMTNVKAPESARVTAANALLDRGYGKPVQAMEHTGKDGGPLEVADTATLSPVEREQRLLAIQLALAASVSQSVEH